MGIVASACALGVGSAHGGAQVATLPALDPARSPRPPSVRMLDGRNTPISAETGSLSVSRMVTNNGTLPRGFGPKVASRDRRDLRIEIDDPDATSDAIHVTLTSYDAARTTVRAHLSLRAERTGESGPYRTELVRLVGDAIDAEAAGVAERTLRVALRDHVVASYASSRGLLEDVLRVGRPGTESGDEAARKAALRIVVLSLPEDGVPVIGDDEASATALMREQVRVANEIWLQCHVSFGDEAHAQISVVEAPRAPLVAIADGDGLPAAGDGSIVFRADGTLIGPVATQKRATPAQTANDVAAALTRVGFRPEVSLNARTRYGAGSSADVLVRRRDGSVAVLTPHDETPLGTDSRQRVALGVVDLSDGLAEFDNMNARAGTLEERALVKALRDDDDATIDLFVVNGFTHATRQGEAFIAQGASAITNTVILDRQGLRHRELAFTLAHEVGHVLLNDPLHPDNVGPDRPWLLMDADSSRGTVLGPKRLRDEECARVRSVAQRSQPSVLAPLLDP